MNTKWSVLWEWDCRFSKHQYQLHSLLTHRLLSHPISDSGVQRWVRDSASLTRFHGRRLAGLKLYFKNSWHKNPQARLVLRRQRQFQSERIKEVTVGDMSHSWIWAYILKGLIYQLLSSKWEKSEIERGRNIKRSLLEKDFLIIRGKDLGYVGSSTNKVAEQG